MEKSFLIVLVLAVIIQHTLAWGSTNSERVRLEDIHALTLHQGQMTTGRRSSPVPQLRCVGGSAGCHAFTPTVVQCINQGSDGYDVQWECKAEMDSAYQFGRLQVSCEGYDSPNDPFILRGSCGLEYELDLTNEGRHRGGGYHQQHYYHSPSRGGGFSFKRLITLVIVGFVIYYGLKFFCGGRRATTTSYSSTGDTRGNYGSGSYTAGGSGSGPGFWTGAATGGVLGYLFGNRGNQHWGYGSGYSYGRPYGGSGWGSSRSYGWGGGGFSSGFGSSSRRSGSSSRSTSGFGGTSRR